MPGKGGTNKNYVGGYYNNAHDASLYKDCRETKKVKTTYPVQSIPACEPPAYEPPACEPPPCPRLPRTNSAQFGYEDTFAVDDSCFCRPPGLCTDGYTGTVPFNRIYNMQGTAITGVNPIRLEGCHTYLVDWSASVNPIDIDAGIQMDVLIDGNVVPGSGAYTDFTKSINGYVSLSGGAIITLKPGQHVLNLRYISGEKGINTRDLNIRIVQIG